jgi:hypothetical protein
MTDLPLLAICLVTYNRTNEALRTILSTCQNLGYPREKMGWYLADDGSTSQHHKALLDAIADQNVHLIGEHNDRFRKDDTNNCGKGWNKGLGLCYQFSDFVLFLEDDWVLEKPLDITPYIKLLQEVQEVGAVSFRILSTGADVHTVGYGGEVFLKYLRTTQYAYSGNPMIRHARYTSFYGWFAEDRNPGLIELHQDDQYRLRNGPEIWRPTSISQWGGWSHIGTDKTWR